MLASHTNIKVLEAQVSNLYLNFLLSFIISVVLILTLSFFLIKKIYKSFILQTEQEIDYLNEQIINLTALNNQLNNQQVKINDSYNEQIKKRITTYHKDELISVSVTDIAFISLQDTVIYIQMFDGMRYVINSSLDEISKVLDPKEFYRANRQYLINIRAISSILLYGKNQLKLTLKPDLKEYVIISKNKASDFKNWLEQ
ncbi:hypothetical protein GN157_11715 [Flavobacterium rakeshii]|uniref:HTH LytTR-type domain-containing protein n=1 Tax=Flavobacterium rakeshii TaxID=1038845 RepID=A0A6N8HF87_9FLAO|nr:LytTR family DNA-binding domain-containing protein [Flavobacterium rakeshii]MUV04375.1 hypothetical protein [Flavobacterium rakeshii]